MAPVARRGGRPPRLAGSRPPLPRRQGRHRLPLRRAAATAGSRVGSVDGEPYKIEPVSADELYIALSDGTIAHTSDGGGQLGVRVPAMRRAAIAAHPARRGGAAAGRRRATRSCAPAARVVSYLSQDATSLNTLTVRPDGGRIEFHDPTVDGGLDPGDCTPGDVAGGFIVQAFCPAAGVERVRIDLGEREDSRHRLARDPGHDPRRPGSRPADRRPGRRRAQRRRRQRHARRAATATTRSTAASAATSLDGGPGADRLLVRDGIADSSAAARAPTRSRPTRSTRWRPTARASTRVETAPPSRIGRRRARAPGRSRWARRRCSARAARAGFASTRPRASPVRSAPPASSRSPASRGR